MRREATVIILALVVCLAALLVVGPGCQFFGKKAAEKAVEKGTGVDIESEKEGAGKKVDTSDIPDEFIYPGSKVKERGKAEDIISVAFETADSVDEVEKYYDDKLTSAGWKQHARNKVKLESREALLFKWSKDNTLVSLSLEEEDGKTEIGIAITE